MTPASLAAVGESGETTPRGSAPLERLVDRSSDPPANRRGGLIPELAVAYDGDLAIPLRSDRPTVVANFVETIDGAVAFDRAGRTGGGDVSGSSATDRFVMGLLRALADVVLVGASTLRTSTRHAWTPGSVAPAWTRPYAAQRAMLGLAPAPTLLIATSSGEVDPHHPAFHGLDQPVIVAGPARAVARLARSGLPAQVTLQRLAGVGPEAIRDLVDAAVGRRTGLIVSEAGPHLFGELILADRADELFLTVAPQLAGRTSSAPRLGLIEGVALWPAVPRWAELLSARRAGDHLFLRYRLEEAL